MGRVLNVTPVNLARFIILPEIAELVPRDMMHNHRSSHFAAGNKLFLAMADPLNVLAIDDVRALPGWRSPRSSRPKKPFADGSAPWMPPRAVRWRTSSRTRK